MLIPTWLLGIVVVGLLLLAFVLNLWDYSLTSSGPVWDHNGLLKTRKLRTLISLHKAQIKNLGANSAAVIDAGMSFARRICLGEKLFHFYEQVKHFPSWYAKAANEEGLRWSSDLIQADAVSTIPGQAIKSFGILAPDDANAREFFLYRFSAQGKAYAFCVHEDDVPSWEDEDAWLAGAYRAVVVELPGTIVLEIRLIYRMDPYADNFRSDYIECFRPGPWLVDLLRVAGLVHAESEERRKSYMKRFEAERAKRFS